MKARLNKNPKQLNSRPASVHNGKNHATTRLADNRTTTALQLQLMENITNSPQAIAQRQQLDQSFGSALQRVEEDELLQGKFATAQRTEPEEEELLQGKYQTAQRAEPEEEELLQGKFETTQRESLDEEEEPLQGKFPDTATTTQFQEETTPPVNKTGMPDHLKSGIESLSGMDMSDVRVHKNSSKPAQLNALAYAQGNDIHLEAGQEQHLPHEAWHVVQQRQGRVKPTMQMAGEMVNDDVGLEREADLMGGRALQMKGLANGKHGLSPIVSKSIAQCQVKNQEWNGAGKHISQGQTNAYNLVNTLNNKYDKVIEDNSGEKYKNAHGMAKTFGGSDGKANINAWIDSQEVKWTAAENQIQSGGASLVVPRANEKGQVTTTINYQAGIYTPLRDSVYTAVEPELLKIANWEKAAPAVTHVLVNQNLIDKKGAMKTRITKKMDGEIKDAIERMPSDAEIKYASTAPDTTRAHTWSFTTTSDIADPKKGATSDILTFVSSNGYAPCVNGWKLKSNL